MIISSKMMIIGPLLVRTISGIYFNKFYIKLAKKRVKQLKEEHLNVDNSKLLEICKTEGAGSVCYCFFIVIFIKTPVFWIITCHNNKFFIK